MASMLKLVEKVVFWSLRFSKSCCIHPSFHDTPECSAGQPDIALGSPYPPDGHISII